MTTDNDTIKVLKKGRELLAKPGGWTQGFLARDAEGREAIVEHGCAFCALGAIYRVTDYDRARYYAPRRALGEALGTHLEGVAKWNDAPGRTVEEVLALYDRAIANEARQP